jgi:two-component system chemotaxis response regulator CheY
MHKRVMIVDDSPVMRSFVRRTLDVAGLPISECLEAGNGQEALSRLAGKAVDLILTDINMPVMDGQGLLASLKADSQFAGIPVVVISTDSTDQRVGELIRLGASGYIRKPFPPERISEVLCGIFPDWQEY